MSMVALENGNALMKMPNAWMIDLIMHNGSATDPDNSESGAMAAGKMIMGHDVEKGESMTIGKSKHLADAPKT